MTTALIDAPAKPAAKPAAMFAALPAVPGVGLPVGFEAALALSTRVLEFHQKNMQAFFTGLTALVGNPQQGCKPVAVAFWEELPTIAKAASLPLQAFLGETDVKAGVRKSLDATYKALEQGAISSSSISMASAGNMNKAKVVLFDRTRGALTDVADGFDAAVDALTPAR